MLANPIVYESAKLRYTHILLYIHKITQRLLIQIQMGLRQQCLQQMNLLQPQMIFQ